VETPGANESQFALGLFPSPCASIKMPADENNFQHASILLLLKLQHFNSTQLHDGFLNWRRLGLNLQLGFLRGFAGWKIIFWHFACFKEC
jgi:hypothetical protein